MTSFKTAIAICGLSQKEAAEFFDVSHETVASWCKGRRAVSNGVWNMLAELYEQIQDAADMAADHMAENGILPDALLSIEAETRGNDIPQPAAKAAGVAGLLMAIKDQGGLQ
ncbi:helix-turn-helix domain-containing protein [Limoniibacter endophyticus]|uniref:HTH cro/C1-type domain-containing protein n=1 Tax=Limoniibacter endophyticus TaxID=1565040 RepID=A0A8J3GIR7_9HYPH|nr:helix-turn-helix transcriptional regulator [Limoniibacter endophyticus]GHC79252.1 hypothetical protein GCM10010136_31660 [Limoniibacter endophyticus]